MCFPTCLPAIQMQWRSTQEGSEEENVSLNGTETKQPAKSQEFSLKIGDPTLLETIRGAGELFTAALNSARVQRTSRHCYDTCQPWCNTYCFCPFTWCLDCFCACLKKEEEEEPDTGSIIESFLNEMKNSYGPISVGMALQQSGWNISLMASEKIEPSADDKTKFINLCQACRDNLRQCLVGGSQQELFKIANQERLLPSKGSLEMEKIKSSLEDIIAGTQLGSSPTCLILYPNHDDDPAPDQRSGYTLKLDRLQARLSQIQVLDLEADDINSGSINFLGFQAKAAIQVIEHTLAKYVDASTDTFNSGGFHLSIEEGKFRSLVLLSLLSLGYCPVSSEGDTPVCLEQLKNTSRALKTKDVLLTDSRKANQGHSPWTSSVSIAPSGLLSGAGKSSTNITLNARMHTHTTSSEVDSRSAIQAIPSWDPTSPKYQEEILKTAQKMSSMTSSLFLS
ncbi:hypothetical protein CP10139811_0369 [Chlamydia ibidis]|uniref:Uncharacterized protein n=2 Tax=Chlamydia ibidis TaxID=1405396 RepID=S7J1U7_9CHLA|nr:hypothetical protein [Chlamydia ibidis]EPP34379.1 hypothetical protein CP10139811_0369 [Chlamydia ibidis]EQM63038.1 hypothetical protein H359_0386 [Chlamydia ibidis 10-1398/6]